MNKDKMGRGSSAAVQALMAAIDGDRKPTKREVLTIMRDKDAKPAHDILRYMGIVA